MRPKVLTTDWSGVVSDDRIPVYETNMRLLERYEIPRIEFDDWLSLSKGSASEFLIYMGVEEGRGSDYLENLYKGELDVLEGEGTIPEAYDDSYPTFRELNQRGIPIVVISSHPEENLRNEAERYDLLAFIQFMISTRNKERALRKTCKRLEVLPSSVLYIGDTVYDIRAGKKAGVLTGGMGGEPRRGYHSDQKLREESPDYMFSDLGEVLGIFI